jgi:hypothetical protein
MSKGGKIIMNTFWLKIAGGMVGIVVIVVVIGMFTSNRRPPQPQQPEKTFYDQAREDKEEFLAKPQAVESSQQQAPEQNQNMEDEARTQAQKTVAPTQQPAPKPAAAPPEPKVLYFKPLSEIDQIEAERLLNVAVPGRSIGRLPMTGFNLMVPNCRRIIEKWPDSWYAYRAKQMLADMPERFWPRYKITEEERDLSMFYKQRPGTQPYNEKEIPK